MPLLERFGRRQLSASLPPRSLRRRKKRDDEDWRPDDDISRRAAVKLPPPPRSSAGGLVRPGRARATVDADANAEGEAASENFPNPDRIMFDLAELYCQKIISSGATLAATDREFLAAPPLVSSPPPTDRPGEWAADSDTRLQDRDASTIELIRKREEDLNYTIHRMDQKSLRRHKTGRLRERLRLARLVLRVCGSEIGTPYPKASSIDGDSEGGKEMERDDDEGAEPEEDDTLLVMTADEWVALRRRLDELRDFLSSRSPDANESSDMIPPLRKDECAIKFRQQRRPSLRLVGGRESRRRRNEEACARLEAEHSYLRDQIHLHAAFANLNDDMEEIVILCGAGEGEGNGPSPHGTQHTMVESMICFLRETEELTEPRTCLLEYLDFKAGLRNDLAIIRQNHAQKQGRPEEIVRDVNALCQELRFDADQVRAKLLRAFRSEMGRAAKVWENDFLPWVPTLAFIGYEKGHAETAAGGGGGGCTSSSLRRPGLWNGWYSADWRKRRTSRAPRGDPRPLQRPPPALQSDPSPSNSDEDDYADDAESSSSGLEGEGKGDLLTQEPVANAGAREAATTKECESDSSFSPTSRPPTGPAGTPPKRRATRRAAVTPSSRAASSSAADGGSKKRRQCEGKAGDETKKRGGEEPREKELQRGVQRVESPAAQAAMASPSVSSAGWRTPRRKRKKNVMATDGVSATSSAKKLDMDDLDDDLSFSLEGEEKDQEGIRAGRGSSIGSPAPKRHRIQLDSCAASSDADETELRSARSGSKEASKKRIRFSDEEVWAISEGVRKHGKGNWAKIKSDVKFAYILMNRTTIDIKDKHRNIMKHLR